MPAIVTTTTAPSQCMRANCNAVGACTCRGLRRGRSTRASHERATHPERIAGVVDCATPRAATGTGAAQRPRQLQAFWHPRRGRAALDGWHGVRQRRQQTAWPRRKRPAVAQHSTPTPYRMRQHRSRYVVSKSVGTRKNHTDADHTRHNWELLPRAAAR